MVVVSSSKVLWPLRVDRNFPIQNACVNTGALKTSRLLH